MIYCYFGAINLLILKSKIRDELRSQQRLFSRSFLQKKKIEMKMIKEEILIRVIKIMRRLMNNYLTIYYLVIDQVGVEK